MQPEFIWWAQQRFWLLPRLPLKQCPRRNSKQCDHLPMSA
jgi:hypothetical protein